MMRAILLASVLGLATVPAEAAVILTFGQTTGTPITATANGTGTSTTITATDAAIDVTEILGGSVGPAFFDLNITSVGPALPIGNGGSQHYAGSFAITSGPGHTGTNLLSGTFSDILLGVGPGGDLAAGAPPDTIALTSAVIPDLAEPSAVALSFAGLTPAFSIDGATVASFVSSVSGTFSASPAAVPEPATWALLAVPLLGLVGVRRWL